MALMLVDYYKHQFEQFWAQGCRPSILFSATPLNKWAMEERKPGVELIDFRVRYSMPEQALGYARTIDSEVRRKVHNSCYETYIRTYFRNWKTQLRWRRSWLEINNHFEAAIQYYWNLIKWNDIKVAIFNDVPHLGSSVILYKICEAMGVVPVICGPSPFPNALWFSRRIEDLGIDDVVSDQTPLRFDIAERPVRPHYMKAKSRLSFVSLAGSLVHQASSIALKTASLGFLWNSVSYRKNIFKMKREFRLFVNQNRLNSAYTPFDPTQIYIYFPLQLQPEASTDVLGGSYGDQLLAIEELSRALPAHMLIYVKENPKQTAYMRDPSFYSRLLAIPQVRFISFEVSTSDLSRNAAAVAAIGGGTAGWEALQMGKPVVGFGCYWYRGLPGCFDWEDVRSTIAEKIDNFRFDRQALQESFRERCRHLWPGVLHKDFATAIPEYDPDIYLAAAVKSTLSYLRCIGFDPAGSPINQKSLIDA